MFPIRAIAPENIFRLGQKLDLVHPIEHALVRRLVAPDSGRRRNRGCDVLHCWMSVLISAKDELLPVRVLLQEFFTPDGRFREGLPKKTETQWLIDLAHPKPWLFS